MSIEEYLKAIKESVLVSKPSFSDDNKFYKNHPNQPRVSENSFKIIKGAGMIINYSDDLHSYLLDCYAIVRQFLVKALIKKVDKNLLDVIEDLIDKEEKLESQTIGSNFVKQLAEIGKEVLVHENYEMMNSGLKIIVMK